jgi:hypothetical protein
MAARPMVSWRLGRGGSGALIPTRSGGGARARALPDAGGRGFRMRARRLVVYPIFIKINKMIPV